MILVLLRETPLSDGSIVLGFQLESLAENRISHFRSKNDEQVVLIHKNGFRFSNYQFNFANVVKVEQKVNIERLLHEVQNLTTQGCVVKI